MVQIDAGRVLRDLKHLRTMGAYKTGVHRPALQAEHVASLKWLEGELKALGHDTDIDGIGNVLGRAPGVGKKVLSGSHLESQNYAGWLDGPLGVVYALEAARAVAADATLAAAGAGVDVVAWCDEEGHFGHFVGSRSGAGKLSDAEIDAARDRTTAKPMREALAAAGLAGRPRVLVEPARYVGYMEAHIEQGDWLEAHALKIGVVTSIVGIRQFRIDIEGVQNHAGTTRMAIRRDAGLTAARLCVAIDERFPKAAGARTVWTTGRIALDPGAPSIIPGKAEVLFQIRDDDLGVLDRLEALLREIAAEAQRSGPCSLNVELIRRSEPARMAASLQAAIEAAAEARVAGKHTRIPSGAGHDAQVMAEIMPSSMLFVPSIGGISHHWTENTSDEDIVLGAQVFADAVGRVLESA
jgi:N-carbamoyl-L-amino-acid hydrolase